MRLFAAGIAIFCACACAQSNSKPSGHWQGKLQIPEHEMGVVVDLAQNSSGVWIGLISVVNSSSIDVPFDSIAVEGSGVRLKAHLPEVSSFDGVVEGDDFSGTASNAARQAPFKLARSGEAAVKIPPPSTALSSGFEGSWEGAIGVEGKQLRIGLKLGKGAGTAVGAFVAIDQNNLEIPATTVITTGKDLQVEARAVSGKYHGTLGDDGQIAGEWSQGPTRLPLTLKRVDPR